MNRLLSLVFALAILLSISSCNLYHALGGHWETSPHQDSAIAIIKNNSLNVPFDTVLYARDTMVQLRDSSSFASSLTDSIQLLTIQQWLPRCNVQTQFSTFSGKAKTHYESQGEDREVTTHFKIEKDKRIWLSVTAFGLVEVARLLITPDTIFAIDRIHKVVRVIPFSESNKLLPLTTDFSTLQSLLMGDALPQHLSVPIELFDSTNAIYLSRHWGGGNFQEIGWNKSDSSILSQEEATSVSNLKIDYKSYSKILNHLFSQSRGVFIFDQGQEHKISLEFFEAVFDEPLEMNFSIPDKYERK